jgi:hypothetical protein
MKLKDVNPQKPGSLRASLVALTVAAFIGACASPKNNFPTLANTGVLPLSTNNPYVGANLYLSDELARSPYLRNFLKGRGAPTAIEVIQDSFNPTRVLMFYPSDREVYAADIVEQKDTHQWIIKGPYGIERRDYRSLAALDGSLHGDPVLIDGGRPVRFRRPGTPAPEVLKPRVPTPTPTPVPTKKPVKRPSIKTPTEQLPDPKAFKPLNTDQQALAMSQGFAERADNGDIIHTVGGDTETITTITAWYTGSTTQAKPIADLNGTNPTDPLPRGKRIRIPIAHLKNLKAMPAK